MNNNKNMKILKQLIDECVKLSKHGDFHLEHLYKEWGASTCWMKDGKWFEGKTPEEAVSKLLKYLKKTK